tara:strand:+ start:2767 stop:3426 length:660 start_codon:yes stop_codon:yes gene_type:complete
MTWTPDRQRRALAVGGAIVVNAALLSLIFFGRTPDIPVPLEALQVTLVTLPPEVDAEPVIEAEPERLPDPEPAPTVEVRQDTVAPEPPPQSTEPPASARSVAEAPDTAPTGERDVYAVSPGTRSILSGIQCPGDPEAFARTGICPDSARRSVRLVAGPESAADHYAIDVTAMRAEWGIGPGLLAGEATLANPQERRNLSSSDQMRDTLPPRVPDPAFGD